MGGVIQWKDEQRQWKRKSGTKYENTSTYFTNIGCFISLKQIVS